MKTFEEWLTQMAGFALLSSEKYALVFENAEVQAAAAVQSGSGAKAAELVKKLTPDEKIADAQLYAHVLLAMRQPTQQIKETSSLAATSAVSVLSAAPFEIVRRAKPSGIAAIVGLSIHFGRSSSQLVRMNEMELYMKTLSAPAEQSPRVFAVMLQQRIDDFNRHAEDSVKISDQRKTIAYLMALERLYERKTIEEIIQRYELKTLASFDEVVIEVQRLWEYRALHKESHKSAQATALRVAASEPSSMPGASTVEDHIVCYGCGEKGHRRNVCPRRSDRRGGRGGRGGGGVGRGGRGGGEGGRLTCDFCGRGGHDESMCYARRDASREAKARSARGASTTASNVSVSTLSTAESAPSTASLVPESSVTPSFVSSPPSRQSPNGDAKRLSRVAVQDASVVEAVVDTGAEVNATNRSELLSDVHESEVKIIGVGAASSSTLSGRIDADVVDGTDEVIGTFTIEGVRLISGAADAVILSPDALVESGVFREMPDFGNRRVVLGDGRIIPLERRDDRMYVVRLRVVTSKTVLVIKLDPLEHSRFGHFGVLSDGSTCDTCIVAKLRPRHFGRRTVDQLAKRPLDVVYVDLAGPLPLGLSGERYIVLFVDECSGFLFADAISRKGAFPESLRKFLCDVGRPKTLRSDNEVVLDSAAADDVLHGGNEGPLVEGVCREFRAIYTPQQMGMIERAIGTVGAAMRCVLAESGADEKFWPFALAHCVRAKNLLANEARADSPIPGEMMFAHTGKKRPHADLIHPFGCRAFVHVPAPLQGNKLQPRARVGVHLGVARDAKAFVVCCDDDGELVVSATVKFDERIFPWKAAHQRGSSIQHGPSAHGEDERGEAVVEARRPVVSIDVADGDDVPASGTVGAGGRPQNDSGGDASVFDLLFPEYNSDDEPPEASDPGNAGGSDVGSRPMSEDAPYRLRDRSDVRRPQRYRLNAAIVRARGSLLAPTTFRSIAARIDADLWYAAVDEHMRAHIEWETFEAVACVPPGKTVLNGTWVFVAKVAIDGKIVRRKARLCAQGLKSKMISGVDFDELYSSTIDASTLRMLVSSAASESIAIVVVDISNAYLYADLGAGREIYMWPPGGTTKFFPGAAALRIRKCIFGLPQSGREWASVLRTFLNSVQFNSAPDDPSLFVASPPADSGVRPDAIGVYVDDLTIKVRDVKKKKKFVDALNARFKTRSADVVDRLLGIDVNTLSDGASLHLSAISHIDSLTSIIDDHDLLLKHMGAESPITKAQTLAVYDEEETAAKAAANDEPWNSVSSERLFTYRSIVGKVAFLARMTRPDVSFVVSFLASRVSVEKKPWQPTSSAFAILYRLVSYLTLTREYGIVYPTDALASRFCNKTFAERPVHVCTDADWASDATNRRSWSGSMIFSHGRLVSWSSKKQSEVAKSSTHAEYVAFAEASDETRFRMITAERLGLYRPSIDPTPLFHVDSQAAMAWSQRECLSKRGKFLDVKYHMVKERLASNEIEVVWISTDDNVADFLTKPLDRARFGHHRDSVMCSLGEARRRVNQT
ncbi:MAG: reverse transcriptase domain-containing protein [Pseudomonadota bacterium]|nr:reverse transcriptase domain-containing protein [Pseudomonadota bacterium]